MIASGAGGSGRWNGTSGSLTGATERTDAGTEPAMPR